MPESKPGLLTRRKALVVLSALLGASSSGCSVEFPGEQTLPIKKDVEKISLLKIEIQSLDQKISDLERDRAKLKGDPRWPNYSLDFSGLEQMGITAVTLFSGKISFDDSREEGGGLVVASKNAAIGASAGLALSVLASLQPASSVYDIITYEIDKIKKERNILTEELLVLSPNIQ